MIERRGGFMSVQRRVKDIFPIVRWEDSYQRKRRLRSKSPEYKFRPRHATLLAMEGIYDNPSFPDFKIHISCRFNDILRAGDTHHFFSCFGPANGENKQPFLRCVDPNWAVIFVTDKKGTFMGRVWIELVPASEFWNNTSNTWNKRDEYKLGRNFGNKLGRKDVYNLVESLLLNLYINGQCHDFRLTEDNPDKYIAY
jgi:hypothetical protein